MSRIRWKNVIIVLVLLLVIAFLIWSIPSKYRVKDNIGLKVSIDPDTIKVGERTRIGVEVKNLYPQSDTIVAVSALTYDDSLVFMETGAKDYRSSDIKIGPSETRQIAVTLESKNAALAGNYRIDVLVKEKGKVEGTQDTIFLKVEKQ